MLFESDNQLLLADYDNKLAFIRGLNFNDYIKELYEMGPNSVKKRKILGWSEYIVCSIFSLGIGSAVSYYMYKTRVAAFESARKRYENEIIKQYRHDGLDASFINHQLCIHGKI